MTIPKFDPIAYQSTRNGFICKENNNPEYSTMLHTADQLTEAYEAGKRDALGELLILGRTNSNGNVVWFGKNPHAFPPCTEFYAAASKGEE